jgi:hypothetical protein
LLAMQPEQEAGEVGARPNDVGEGGDQSH